MNGNAKGDEEVVAVGKKTD